MSQNFNQALPKYPVPMYPDLMNKHPSLPLSEQLIPLYYIRSHKARPKHGKKFRMNRRITCTRVTIKQSDWLKSLGAGI